VQRTERGRVGEAAFAIAKGDGVTLTVRFDHAYCTDVQTTDAS